MFTLADGSQHEESRNDQGKVVGCTDVFWGNFVSCRACFFGIVETYEMLKAAEVA